MADGRVARNLERSSRRWSTTSAICFPTWAASLLTVRLGWEQRLHWRGSHKMTLCMEMRFVAPANRLPWSLGRSDDIGNVEDLAAPPSVDFDNGLSLTANPLVKQRTLPLARLAAAVIVTRRRVVDQICGARTPLLSIVHW